MCKRSDEDPLIRVLTDRYRLNILRMPRPGIGVGELLIREGKDLRCSGSVSRLFDPPLSLPDLKVVPLPDVSGMTTVGFSAAASAAPLAGFLAALGVVGVSSVEAGLRRAQGVSVSFSLTGTQYHSSDVVTLGEELADRLLRQDNALYTRDRAFYLVTAAATVTGMRIAFSADSESAAKAALSVQHVIDTQSSIVTRHNTDGYLAVSGPEAVTFGVAVMRLKLDGNSLLLMDAGRSRAVRGTDGGGSVGASDDPTVLFGGSAGQVLVNIE
jgi:hypothetical protein